MTHPGADFYIKSYDTVPPIQATLEDGLGNRVNIEDADVLFVMRHITDPDSGRRPGPQLFAKPANNDQSGAPTMGDVSYDWEEGDTDIPGGYRAEWEVTFSDGSVETFPNAGHVRVAIIEHLEDAAS
jgi:hypothetical protein